MKKLNDSNVQFDLSKTGRFLGRNGMFKCAGIDVLVTADDKEVIISPITSKGLVGRCEIWIPKVDVSTLIKALKSV